MQSSSSRIRVGLTLLICLISRVTLAADWPQWRFDARRSAVTPEQLPEKLHLLWVREFAKPRPAWVESSQLLFDRTYEPVVVGKTIFVPSHTDDSLSALDTQTGDVRWQFFADGPIRFAPVATREHVYIGSDDGHVYCLQTADGKLNWKFRAGPKTRHIFGNDRLISTWPVRGGPVLTGGRIYFTAGVFPFMGIFAYALDAESGEIVWSNDTSGSVYITPARPSHKSGRGASPQGYLTAKTKQQLDPLDRAAGDVIIAPCGGSSPILFDMHTGELKHAGGLKPYFGSEASLARYKSIYNFGFKKGAAGGWFVTKPNLFSDKRPEYKVSIQAGGRTYNAENCPQVEGEVVSILAADGKLFVVDDLGHLSCFGAPQGVVKRHQLKRVQPPENATPWMQQAGSLLKQFDLKETPGIAVVLGAGTGQLAQQLVQQSDLNVIVLEPDAKQVDQLRRRWNSYGWYGTRLHILPYSLMDAGLPPYVARLITSEDDNALQQFANADRLPRLFERLRPYGGVAALPGKVDAHAKLLQLAIPNKLHGANVATKEGWVTIGRIGALPGAGEWTHEHGDAGNTLFSPDNLVKSPLGILWFGGQSARLHAYQADPVLVAGGRMFLYTRHGVSAIDIYSGRVLWTGGKRASGLRCYAATGDAYYSAGVTADGKQPYIVMLDARNGTVAQEVSLAADVGEIKEIRAWQKTLIVTTTQRIIALNRHDLSQLWIRKVAGDIVPRLKVGYGKSRGGPANHGLAVGGGRVYCIYGMSAAELAALKRRGKEAAQESVLMALDIKTGETLWHHLLGDSFLSWLAYSAEHDVLLQTVDFRVKQQGQEVAYRGESGKILWQVDAQGHVGPPHVLNGDKVIPQSGGAYHLLTGKPIARKDQLTGADVKLDYQRIFHFGGCNYAVGSRHLMTFRSGTGAYCDISRGPGTGLLGGDRTGCRNSMIVAGGVLNSPNISGCACNFPIRGASLALVHSNDGDAWTHFGTKMGEGRIQQVGVNLGAPGDRTADNGTLWLDAPNVGGPAPPLEIVIAPTAAKPFQFHPARIESTGLNWVAASGIEGAESITLPLTHFPTSESYSVRWEGKLKCDYDETYTFHADADDGVRVWVDGKLIIDAWEIPRAVQWTFPYRPYRPRFRGFVTGQIDLKRDKLHDLKVEYYNRDGGGELRFAWSCSSLPKRTAIPADHLSSKDGQPGVMATFFDDLDFKGRSIAERTPTITGRWAKITPPALKRLPPKSETQQKRHYTVRLYFAEPAAKAAGQRQFDVALQGKVVLKDFDVIRAADGPQRIVMQEFQHVEATDKLIVGLIARKGSTLLCGVEAILEPEKK